MIIFKLGNCIHIWTFCIEISWTWECMSSNDIRSVLRRCCGISRDTKSSLWWLIRYDSWEYLQWCKRIIGSLWPFKRMHVHYFRLYSTFRSRIFASSSQSFPLIVGHSIRRPMGKTWWSSRVKIFTIKSKFSVFDGFVARYCNSEILPGNTGISEGVFWNCTKVLCWNLRVTFSCMSIIKTKQHFWCWVIECIAWTTSKVKRQIRLFNKSTANNLACLDLRVTHKLWVFILVINSIDSTVMDWANLSHFAPIISAKVPKLAIQWSSTSILNHLGPILIMKIDFVIDVSLISESWLNMP